MRSSLRLRCFLRRRLDGLTLEHARLPREISRPAVSPDGARVAYALDGREIRDCGFDGGECRAVEWEGGYVSELRWHAGAPPLVVDGLGVVTASDRRRWTTVGAGHLFEKEVYGVLQAADRAPSRAARGLLETLQAA